ncbi:SGNH/GDSL hydrolase family protein [Terasakiella sp. SH-1]|uniref:SGNH/GDSL hydrolase family protein n=1 Tax=Terasakiella sp. SH-1 TaxID=2560057 RepID=UPI0014306954|nr:SGNH/GDSL hydrolase family protein [Terasakiella sp. SH-1]
MLLFLLVLVVMTEMFLSLTAQGHQRNTSSQNRHLLLREWHPNTDYRFRTPESRFSENENVPDFYEISTDENGFILPNKQHAIADKTLVFLGGSTTECMFVDPKKRFPYLTGRLLADQTSLKVNSYNAGRSGNNVMMSNLQLMGKIIPMRPDYVIMMHGVNDIGVLGRKDGYWTDHPTFSLVRAPKSGLVPFLLQIRDATVPLTYRALKSGILKFKQLVVSPAHAQNGMDKGKSFESALRTFVRTAKAWQIKPVLMTQVVLNNQDSKSEYLSKEQLAKGGFNQGQFEDMQRYFNEITRSVALSEGALLIDLVKAKVWTGQDLYDDLHYSDQGSEKVARIISQHIQQDLKQ